MPSFRSDKFIFIHYPKTGGMWFWHVCQMWGVPILARGPDMKSHRAAPFFQQWDKLPWIAVYRNPMDWYTSLYNYHVKMDWWWKPIRKGLGFHQFVEICLMTKPYSVGFHEMVIKPKQLKRSQKRGPGELQWFPPTYLIQYENMYEELAIVMNKLGYPRFTEEGLRNVAKRNTRSMKGHRGRPPSSYCPALTPELREKIMEVDKPIFDLYRNHDAIVAEW